LLWEVRAHLNQQGTRLAAHKILKLVGFFILRSAMHDIGYYRHRIDQLDEEILALLNERAQAAAEIGILKRQLGLPVLDSNREQDILARLTSKNNGPLKNENIGKIFSAIMSGCREVQ
jgi:chorismate mutase